MRLLKYAVICVTMAGLAGCAGLASHSPAASDSAATLGPVVITSTGAAAPPVSPTMQAGARSAATQFYALYSASQFAAAWSLLSPATRNQVPKSVWVGVHEACPGTAVGKARVIKAVTAFGSAAIVTEAIAGSTADPGTTEDVFNYIDGQWSYSPGELSIYGHGSATADIAAAKAAGFCAGWKVF